MSDDPKFDQWWNEHGQYVRAGGGQYEISFAFAAWQASRAMPADHISQARNSVIEECAAVLDRRINGWRARGKTILSGQTVADELEHHAHTIRALKSAPHEKPAGDVLSDI